jgi:chorismate mutase
METAKAISDLRLEIGDWRFIFRAGVWKPRTSPHTFQGVGAPALEWLKEVKDTFGMEIATEVASPEHVEAALRAGVDYLWIGARSSANPIVVQEIANAIEEGLRVTGYGLRGVLIKNPVNQDADLWLGNIERIEKAVKGLQVTGDGRAVYGVECKVYAIHRGCGHKPCWGMAHKVRLARPDIPMLLDPSHMSGEAAKVPALMSKVAELGLDGAMIEVHANPEQALSDRKQQIRPDEIGDWRLEIEDLKDTELNWLRAEIDELDEQLWDTIAARMDVSKRIGEWKKAHGVAPLQPERVKVIGERLKVTGERLHLSEDFIQKMWDIIHEESLKQQK